MTTPGTDRDGQAVPRQPEREMLPLPIAILLGATRMRRALSRSRRLPGLPLLLLARRHTRWTAQPHGFELPWSTGRMIGEPGSSDDALPPPSVVVAVSPGPQDRVTPPPSGAAAVPSGGQDRAAVSLAQPPSPGAASIVPAASGNADRASAASVNPRGRDDLDPGRGAGPHRRRDEQISTPHEGAHDVPLTTLASIMPAIAFIARGLRPAIRHDGEGMSRLRAAAPSLPGLTGKIDGARSRIGHATPSAALAPATTHLMTLQVSGRTDASATRAPGRGDASPPHQLQPHGSLPAHEPLHRPAESPMPSRTIAMAGPTSAAGAPAPSGRQAQGAADAPPSATIALTGKSGTLLPPPLVGSGKPATSHNVGNLLAVAVGLRGFLVRELDDLRRQVATFTSRPQPAAAPPEPAADNDTARRMLNRMRTITQEERFRSGKLR